MFGLGIGRLGVVGGKQAFSPAKLFTAGEQGAWYDPSDFSTMFQDSSGTTPVTAVEQPVGKILDKSGRGNHASQSTTTKRPILRARHNLLTYSEQFDNAAWSRANVNVTQNATTAPDGTATADLVVPTTANGIHYVTASAAYGSGEFCMSFYAKAAGYPRVGMRVYDGTAYRIRTTFDISNGTVVLHEDGTSGIEPVGNGWYRCWCSGISPAGNMGIVAGWDIEALPGANKVQDEFTGDGVSGAYIWGAQVNYGSTAGTYQRIAAATDYDTVGFQHYFDFDGTDDSWATASIDFSATDKMSVFAGVRKNNDVAAIVAELSSSPINAGAFYLAAGTDAGGTGYSSMGKGTAAPDIALASKAFTFYAPETAVLTVTHDIAGDLSTIRRNGTAGTNATADKGAGNFGNYPLYICARSGTSVYLTGRIYSLIVLGRTATAAEITATEAWVANKTGVQL